MQAENFSKGKFIVSACLAGINCCHDGSNRLKSGVRRLVRKEKAIAFCPEQLGGLPTPRPPAEIISGSGEDVLARKARVLDKEGRNVTENFLQGAYEGLQVALAFGVETAILKARSPSCGFGIIYDGSFSGKTKKGNGVTAALFLASGLNIITEEDL